MSSGEDKIVSNILSEAQVKADSIIQEAELKSKSITEDGSKKAELERNKILDDANKQSKMKYQQIISEAKMNSRRLELGTREEVIEESFKKASEELKNIASTTDAEYIDSLIKIIKEAAIEINGGDLIIHTKEEDIVKIKNNIDDIANSVKSVTGNDTKLDFGESIQTVGGAILKTRNGEIEVNNTIESRLLRFKKSLRSEVANILFN
ncbi:V-type proton ATPase subunit E [Methanobrevibacter filiformis]|uniref:A-type ATP synthase subunit E n=1 Tax=Methanobrevibacter filiformis TaxID=55758 RepID=A0A166CWM0_9EURY|nr:V-type proton ATPase subunit E [Methanobrevibacter filiformis]KZX14943.1 V-type proton ATPase subunit E [Methanobrevibacter filiformis]